MDMREKMARAAFPEAFDLAAFNANSNLYTRHDDFQRGQDRALAKVDAILAVLEEPSVEAVKASEAAYETDAFGVKSAWASDIFRAMIRAIRNGA